MMLSSVAGRAVSRRPTLLTQCIVARQFSDEPKKAVRHVKKKEKKSKGSGEGGGRPRELELILSALDAPVTKPPPVTDEEEIVRRAEILRNYTIGRFKQHNEDNHDLTCKIRMKQHAIKMLPRDSKLKEKALEVDSVGPPRWRNIPVWTPPIPGFDPRVFRTTEE
jgi:hypothetical protein